MSFWASRGPTSVDNSTLQNTGGVLRIKAGGVANSHIVAAAGIPYSKLNLLASVDPTDLLYRDTWYCRYPGYGTALGEVVAAAAVRFFPLYGPGASSATEAQVEALQVNQNVASIITLLVDVSANAATGGTMALRADGADIGATVNLATAGAGRIAMHPTGLGVGTNPRLALRVSPTGGNVTLRGARISVG